MIQLIGFSLCVYMLVRGLEIASRVEDRKSRSSIALANIAGAIAIVGAFLFAVLIVMLGKE